MLKKQEKKQSDTRTQGLLKDYRDFGRTSSFQDNRINGQEEEAVLARFAKEQKKKLKGQKFSLEDNDVLTHGGKTLGSMSDNDIKMALSEDLGELDMSDPYVQKLMADANFGGGDFDDATRTREDIYQEVIAKSKLHRMEQQKQQKKVGR